MKFKKGDVIERIGRENYSHANIYSAPFKVAAISPRGEYELKQPNFYGYMDAETVDYLFIKQEAI